MQKDGAKKVEADIIQLLQISSCLDLWLNMMNASGCSSSGGSGMGLLYEFAEFAITLLNTQIVGNCAPLLLDSWVIDSQLAKNMHEWSITVG